MKKQVSPAVIAGAIAVLVITLGAFYYRQYVHASPTPRPNQGVSMGGPSASVPVHP
jgi:hypothetical protein